MLQAAQLGVADTRTGFSAGAVSTAARVMGRVECLVSRGRWAVEAVNAGGFDPVLFSSTSSRFGAALSRRTAGSPDPQVPGAR